MKHCIVSLCAVFVLFGITGCSEDNPLGPSDEILSACRGVCDGHEVDGAAAYTSSEGVHPIVVFSSPGSDMRPKFNDILPEAWIPESVAEVELVAYVSNEYRDTLQTCRYFGGAPIRRIQFKRDILLYGARDASLIESETIEGTRPGSCPNPAPWDQTQVLGSRVTGDVVKDWLRTYVEL